MPNEAKTLKDVLSEYFKEKGVEYKESGNEQFVLKSCPSCADNKFHHFYMNANSGLWDCKKCGSKGNFNQFRNFFGDSELDLSAFIDTKPQKQEKTYRELKYDLPLQYASKLFATDLHYLEYLKNVRKLKEEVIREFKIGSNGDGISIPIYENNILVNIRYRRDPRQDGVATAAPRYSQEKGCKAALFNGDVLMEDGISQVYITEGEFDALQLIQLGFRNTVSTTLGSGYFPDEWVEKFNGLKNIYLCYDTDKEGKEGMKKVAEKLGWERCKVINIPAKATRKKTDITNYFTEDGGDKDSFLSLVKTATSALMLKDIEVKHIADYNERLRELLLAGEHFGISTGFTLLDDMVGGLRKGRLIVLSGLTNSGKSSMAVNMCLNMASAKFPCFYFSLEMPPIDIAKKILMLKAKLKSDDLKKVVDPSPVLDRVDKALAEFKGSPTEEALPIYLYNGSGVVKYKVLEDCVKIAKEQFNCQAIFVDHLHYFASNYGNLAAETSQVVRSIKQLAIGLDIPIILLAHLNRGGRTKARKGLYIPSLADLKETSTIEQDADQVLFVCRDSESEDVAERTKCFVKVAKNRDGQAGRSVSMEFDEEITCFSESKSGVDYEQDVVEQKVAMDSEVVTESLPF